MSRRVLVTYTDELGDVVSSGEASSEHNAGGIAWRELVSAVGGERARLDHTRRVLLLPGLADVRYVIGRGTGPSRVEVCAYGRLATARAAIDALAGLTDHHYTVEVDVVIPRAVNAAYAATVTCPECEGAGEHNVCPRPGFCSHEEDRQYPCRTCGGETVVTRAEADAYVPAEEEL